MGLILVHLLLLDSLCIKVLLQGLNERKTFIYNHLTHGKYSIEVLFPLPFCIFHRALQLKGIQYIYQIENVSRYLLDLNPG